MVHAHGLVKLMSKITTHPIAAEHKEANLAIRVRGLINHFGTQTVHDGLDIDVHRGEILGVVGGSGTGKSVLMRTILGLHTPNAGSIEVLGVNPHSQSSEDRRIIARNTGVLFQDGALFSSMTVGENVQVPMKEHHGEFPKRLYYELALLKIKLAGLPANALDKLPSQLSGGMRKRAGLARALALDPHCYFWTNPPQGWIPSAQPHLTNSSKPFRKHLD